jgi:microcystin degradation protein MlrC
MRIGILALLHESNTFISRPTTIEHFAENLFVTGEEVREKLAGTHHEVGGFFAGLAEEKIEATPLFAARAMPYGVIEAATFSQLVNRLLETLAAAPKLDGLLVAPHGATVAENAPDADGFWLSEVRRAVGPAMPIVGTLDPHANLSPAMVAATNALTAYRTNPHLDQQARGLEAARLMARTLRGEIRPLQAAAFPAMAINIERQETAAPHLAPLYKLADAQLEKPGGKILSNSILLGFPYADVAEMGSATLAIADGDRAAAQAAADELASEMWRRREDYLGQLVSIEQAVSQAATLVREHRGPVCLLDMGDNVGGGSPADGTLLAHALIKHQVAGSFVCLYDPEAVRECDRAGVGQRVRLTVGGKTDRLHGEPLVGEFTIISLHEGRFSEPEPRHGGFKEMDQGRTAVVRSGAGLTLLINSLRTPPFSLRQITSCGLDPASFGVLVAKGVNAPLAAYAPVCRDLIRVNTPGVTSADMESLEFKHRRRPMFPFER